MKLAPQLSTRCAVLFGPVRLVATPNLKPRIFYKLPKPRQLTFSEYRETSGNPVIEAFITTGFGPWKREIRSFIFGGQWIARASAKPLK